MSIFIPRADLPPTERRRTHRGRAFKSGQLIYGGFSSTIIDCLIIEMSGGVARVEPGLMVPVPEILVLRLNDTDRQVRRAWAIGNEIGLEFLAQTVSE